MYSWRPILERKECLAQMLDADWFMNLDADEIRLSPRGERPLAEAFAEVDRLGYNAVNFQEFTFIPTQEATDHDHPDFLATMRSYYPFSASPLNQVKAWKRQDAPVRFSASGGHRLEFPNLRIWPEDFVMKHYMFVSVEHAVRKYVERTYDPRELTEGWHRQRAALRRETIRLPRAAQLRRFVNDATLDASNPLARHFLMHPARAPA